MRLCTPFGLVMALTLGLILMMSHKGECRVQANGLPPGLGTMVVAAGSTARMHGLAIGPRSRPSLAPSPLPSDDGDLRPPSDMAPPPTPLGPASPITPPAPSPLLPPPSLAPSTSLLPSSPGPSQHPASPPTTTPPAPPLASPHPSPSLSPSPQSPPPTPSPPPSPLPSPPQSPSLAPSSPPTTSSPTPPSPVQPSTPPSAGSPTPSGLQVGFYKARCPKDVEALIATLVANEFSNNATILPALLRMQFHDCFVHGCDASILIDGPQTEKTAGPNLSVRGYEFIDALKAAVEEQCPGMVSCADIVAVATKEVLKLGGGPDYPVETGRRDGLVSNAADVNLPSPDATASQGIEAFGARNFTVEEMVVLLGCHTVGIAHCAFFQDRLYPDTPLFDPNMDPSLRRELIPVCPKGTITNNFAFLDQNPASSNIVDNSFFIQILNQRGILEFDQVLGRDPTTIAFVQELAANGTLFNDKLAQAMVKLQAVDVLTGDQGEIRKVCSRVN